MAFLIRSASKSVSCMQLQGGGDGGGERVYFISMLISADMTFSAELFAGFVSTFQQEYDLILYGGVSGDACVSLHTTPVTIGLQANTEFAEKQQHVAW